MLAVIIQENQTWIVQAIPYDITGHGSTREAAIENFKQTARGQMVLDRHFGLELLAQCPPAPKFYLQNFAPVEIENE